MSTVSIILPTYNRARFLPQAFASIREQTCVDWELIVVDDGSTDDTQQVVAKSAEALQQEVHYVYQKNAGPAVARNTGIDRATGKYLAFLDSDDQWLPHHLTDCVRGLDQNPDVDWIYAAGRRVDERTGEVLLEHSFYPEGRPRAFRNLKSRQAGDLYVIDDPGAVVFSLENGLYAGLQNSVLRASRFRELRIPLVRIGEDRHFITLALKNGCRFAYFDDVHTIYYVHGENISDASASGSLDKRVAVLEELIRGYEDLGNRAAWSRVERRALCQRLSQEYFWSLGYAMLLQNGRRGEALRAMRRGLRHWPYDWRCWKTYLLAVVRGGGGERPMTNDK